jgi:hypothetical protein
MARDNPTWGQERIANELLLKLDLRVWIRNSKALLRRQARVLQRHPPVAPVRSMP